MRSRMFFSIFFLILIATLVFSRIKKRYKECFFVIKIVIFVGILCFLGIRELHWFGQSLASFEFPAVLQSKTIKTPNGKIFSANGPQNRIQRYSKDGEFETGWFVAPHGGNFTVGMDRDGGIVFLSARRDQIEVYDQSGNLKYPPIPYNGRASFKVPLGENDLKGARLSLIDVEEVENPKLSKQSALLIIFANPFLPLILFFLAIALAELQLFLNKKTNKFPPYKNSS